MGVLIQTVSFVVFSAICLELLLQEKGFTLDLWKCAMTGLENRENVGFGERGPKAI